MSIVLDQQHLDVLFKNLSVNLPGNRTFTENGAGAFNTTGSACLDFFGTIVRDTSVSEVVKSFIAAWNEDPLLALKLVLNLRDIRKGKGEKKLSLVLMYVLSSWKPLTYLAYLKEFINLGCYKDLLVFGELAIRCSSLKYFDRLPELESEKLELKIISTQLSKDFETLNTKPTAAISLCAKWAPTENTHFDRKPLRFAHKVAKLQGLNKKGYRQQLTRLRNHLKIVEEMMCNDKWEQIAFDRVPAKAIRVYRHAFSRDTNAKAKDKILEKRVACHARYAEFLTNKDSKIKSTGTQPHELIQGYMKNHPLDETIEMQWKDLVAKLAVKGNFKRVQAVCDVSGSMTGTPMEVAIALGLIVAELTEEPFKNQLITFHTIPTLHTIQGTTLAERVIDVMGMEWGGSTDLRQVFQLLINQAKEKPEAQMVEKLFIFSDMQFNQASDCEDWDTTYQEIQKMYAAANFAVPQIIFWNLRATHRSEPVEKSQVGTALISGFSANMMNCFLDAKDIEFNPMDIMLDALKDYKSDPIPETERTPLPDSSTWEESLEQFEELVNEFIVPHKIVRKRKLSEENEASAESDEPIEEVNEAGAASDEPSEEVNEAGAASDNNYGLFD